MAATKLTPIEIVESHRPKNFKYKFYFKDEEFLNQLTNDGFDIFSSDTIKNDELTNYGYEHSTWEYVERTVLGKAKEPTIIDDGIIISKKMITKADKKLAQIGIGFFTFNETEYVCVKLVYEKFDILEIFVKL